MVERAEGGSDGSTTAISPGSVLVLAALVALVTAVVATVVIVQLVDDDPSQDEMAAVLRGELREFVLERTAEPPATTTTSIPQLPVDDDLLGLEGETFPTELATLTVHTDGCGVIRTEFEQNPRNLTWSVKDVDGFEVLGRNAEGETRYRYFQPGTYTVELEAWNGDHYAPVSNRVTIKC